MFKKWNERYHSRGLRNLSAILPASYTARMVQAKAHGDFCRNMNLVSIAKKYPSNVVANILRERHSHF